MTPKPRSVIFVVTAFDDAKVARLDAGQVHAIIRKPFDVTQLVTMIREVTVMWHAQTVNVAAEQLPSTLDTHDDVLLPEPTN
jgi:DNA-binding NarL/FixJ family response regulator